MSLPLHIVTIVKDGMPFITWHLPIFDNLQVPWTWHITHGAADNVHCTKWCAKPVAGLSEDGTTEYLQLLKSHPRIRIYEAALWPGKVAMFNTALATIKEPCVLMEVDVDEIWTAQQIGGIVASFEMGDHLRMMKFFCNFYLGPNIITVGENCYGNNPGEWTRAFRFFPGMRFLTHEPPVLDKLTGLYWEREETRTQGLVFNHFAYCFASQLRQKEKYYQYPNALAQWQRLQTNTVWPVKRLKDFLDWVDDYAGADLLHKP